MSVLTGRAHLKSSKYTKKSDHKEHAKPAIPLADGEAKEIGSELSTRTPIFGLETKKDTAAKTKVQTPKETRQKQIPPQQPTAPKKPAPAATLQPKKNETATHIIQTKSSTIVTEKPQSGQTDSTSITVLSRKKPAKKTEGKGAPQTKNKKSTGTAVDVV